MKTLIRNPFTRTKPPVAKQITSNNWEDRDCILRADINLFCWKRSLDPTIHAYLTLIASSTVKPIVLPISSSELVDQMEKARLIWDRDSPATSDAFWQDVFNLATDFLSFSANGTGKLHLKVIDDNACSKFHTDGYTLRLFTTYLGKGTEWLPEEAVNRHALGKTNELIIKDASQIQRMDTFEVGILKGQSNRDPVRTKGIVHRSPPIKQENSKRVILRIDI